jgi:hypothetical protein
LADKKDNSKKGGGSDSKVQKSESNKNTTGISISQGNYLNTSLNNPGNVPTWK